MERLLGSALGILDRGRPSARRSAIAVLMAGAALAIGAPGAMASFGVEESNFEAGTCVTSSCTYASVKGNPAEAFTQAAGHPPDGITQFEFNHQGSAPEGSVKNIRVDLPAGLAGNPNALAQCPKASFENNECSGETQVGTNELDVYDGLGDLN